MTTATATRPSGAQIRTAAALGLTGAMGVGAAAVGTTLGYEAPAGISFTLDLLAVFALACAAELAAVHRTSGGHRHTLSLSEVALVIGLAFTAPITLVFGRTLAGLLVYGGIRRVALPKLAFNTTLFAFETAAGASVYRLVLGQASPADPQGWLAALAGMAVTTAIGLGAVRLILAVHQDPAPRGTTAFSLAITAAGTLLGILGVVALRDHAQAAFLVAALTALAFAAMRVVNRER